MRKFLSFHAQKQIVYHASMQEGWRMRAQALGGLTNRKGRRLVTHCSGKFWLMDHIFATRHAGYRSGKKIKTNMVVKRLVTHCSGGLHRHTTS